MLVKFKKNGFKGNLVKAYNYYCLVNNIVWDRPKYKWEQNKPKIPTEESLNKIIASWGLEIHAGAKLETWPLQA